MKYTHLTKEERYQIERLISEGFSQIEIGERLGRSRATISRELRRNKGERAWYACRANEKAQKRLTARGEVNARKISKTAWEYAKKQLINEQWSPEQIAGRLKLEGKESISHESLYQKIYEDKKDGGSYLSIYVVKNFGEDVMLQIIPASQKYLIE